LPPSRLPMPWGLQSSPFADCFLDIFTRPHILSPSAWPPRSAFFGYQQRFPAARLWCDPFPSASAFTYRALSSADPFFSGRISPRLLPGRMLLFNFPPTCPRPFPSTFLRGSRLPTVPPIALHGINSLTRFHVPVLLWIPPADRHCPFISPSSCCVHLHTQVSVLVCFLYRSLPPGLRRCGEVIISQCPSQG